MVQRLLRRMAALSAALAVAGAARVAQGQSTPNVVPNTNGDGFDTHLFRPAMDSKGLFSVNGTDIIGAKSVSFGLILDYAHTLLRTATSVPLIEHSFQGTLQFNYGIANRVVVGVDLPVDLMSGPPTPDANGQPLFANQWGPGRLDFQGVADVAAHAKWRILKVEHGFGLALGAQAGWGLAGAASNAGADPGFWYWPMVAAEK